MTAAQTVVERAHAKVNLVLRVGPPRADGMHPLSSLFAALELADEVRVTPLVDADRDLVVCAGVEGENLAAAAAAAFRTAAPDAGLPPLRIEIDKAVPVAAGLAGGSADAAAVLRAANALAGAPLSPDELRGIAARLGSDVPSQVEPTHAIVTGVGERVERVDLPPMTLVLVPQDEGLSTAAVYGELDRIGGHAGDLDPAPLRALAAAEVGALAAGLANDLQPAALALRPELSESLAALRVGGALAAQVTGSGPTTFGVFADRLAAEAAVASIDGRRAADTGKAPPPPPIVTELLS
ncbi:MAG TPA: 4-(cytidine 5'-diphospho)-2-C-methyl-D-erythritol kinase [Thermoleophilaceae bacterium]|nr:4-(cytidine 5'-diphospho)-2-C-methyl-D-erythritol kinase [Thermoleophilaceae bacterium]